MRPPAPITPMRMVSLAPRTLVEASAVIPLAMMKLRRLGVNAMLPPHPFLFRMILSAVPGLCPSRQENGGTDHKSYLALAAPQGYNKPCYGYHPAFPTARI